MSLVRCCEGRVPVAERRGEGTNCQRRLTRIASSLKPAMQEGEGVKLHLLIDTSVWLDLAKDYRQLPILDALSAMSKADELTLILPRIVVDEFERNKERVIAESKRSLSSHFKLVREAIVQFAPAGFYSSIDRSSPIPVLSPKRT